ncbi:hypothetical protein C9374_000659 [Naegleria lovaniensis]|uniref:F-box domain-containing protein n=1 Tax=Naegleria lovaniensis TaxID=51637 RepID=A0AA88KM31_NAELO|nr:uncharacterized protein C9374_000659 [Naegleria lovaniensis]KAG2388495.1 hypothetical protein C9374_000659 [Naegleria lovaniensis]
MLFFQLIQLKEDGDPMMNYLHSNNAPSPFGLAHPNPNTLTNLTHATTTVASTTNAPSSGSSSQQQQQQLGLLSSASSSVQASGVNIIRKTPSKSGKGTTSSSLGGASTTPHTFLSSLGSSNLLLSTNASHHSLGGGVGDASTSSHPLMPTTSNPSSEPSIPLIQLFSTLPDAEDIYQRILVFLPYTSALRFSYASKYFNQLAKKHSPYLFSMNQFVQWSNQVCALMMNSTTSASNGGSEMTTSLDSLSSDLVKMRQHSFLRAVQVIARSCRIQLLLNELFHKETINIQSEDTVTMLDMPSVGVYMCIPLSSRVEFSKKHKMVRQLIDTISLQNIYYQEMCTFLLGKLQIIEFEQIKGEENYGFSSVIQLIPDLQQLDQKVYIHQNLMTTTLQHQKQKKRVILYQMSIGTNSPKYAQFLGLSGDMTANDRQVLVIMAGSKYEFNDIILYKLCQLSGVITNTTSMSVTEMFQFLAMCGTLDTCQAVIEQYYTYKRNNLQTFSSTPQKFEVYPRESDTELKSFDFVASLFLKQYIFDLTNIKSTKIYLLDLLINMSNQLLCDIQLSYLPRRLLNYQKNTLEYEKAIRSISNVFGREVRFRLLGSNAECTSYSVLRLNILPTLANKLLSTTNKSICELVFNFVGFTSFKYVGAEQERNLRLTVRTSNKKLAFLLGIKEERDVVVLNNQTINMRILKNLTEILQLSWPESELLFFLLAACSCIATAHFTESAKTAFVETEWNTAQKETFHPSIYYISEQLSKILQCPSVINAEEI